MEWRVREVEASFGRQVGGQMFMSNSALELPAEEQRLGIGSGPSVDVEDRGTAASMTTTT